MKTKINFFPVILLLIATLSCLPNPELTNKSRDTAPINTRAVIQNSLNQVLAGLESYQQGNFPDTREKFDIALENLIAADLPDQFKNLNMLQAGLPREDNNYNLEDIYNEVSQEEEKAGAGDINDNVADQKKDLTPATHLTETIPEKNKQEAEEKNKYTGQEMDETGSIKSLIEKEVKRLAAEFGETDFAIPESFLKKVEDYILLYQTKQRIWFQASMKRGEDYIPMIKSIFLKEGLPPDFVYMALVESGFNPRAKSPAGARGIWQFMAGTAKRYNLTVERRYDERLDPRKSTVAASEYISDLVMVFGSRSFMLAMAAFNAGDGRVRYALKKVDSFKKRSFWDLVDHGYLKRETCEYVPKIIAATVIGCNPQLLGFGHIKNIDIPRHDTIRITTPKRLSLLADLCEISREELFKLNPDINRKNIFTPSSPDISEYKLFIPEGKGEELEKKLAMIENDSRGKNICLLEENPKTPSRETRFFAYQVKRGNTLRDISRWFNKSKKVIINWNQFLQKRGPMEGDVIFIYDYDPNLTKSIHRVKKGESLWVIGRRYKIDPALISAWNGIRKNRLFPGQKLTVYHDSRVNGSFLKIAQKSGKSGKYKLTYQVKSGDCLSGIALSFKVTVGDLKRWNNLKNNRIKAGQYLIIITKYKA